MSACAQFPGFTKAAGAVAKPMGTALALAFADGAFVPRWGRGGRRGGAGLGGKEVVSWGLIGV